MVTNVARRGEQHSAPGDQENDRNEDFRDSGNRELACQEAKRVQDQRDAAEQTAEDERSERHDAEDSPNTRDHMDRLPQLTQDR